MDKNTFNELLVRVLERYNFKAYGPKLFYLDLKDSIIVLEQIIYNGCGELYLSLIIKECHPEITKITKKILKDNMLIDTHTYNRLLYKTTNGYRWDFFDIEVNLFEDTIDEVYNEVIKPFETSCLYGLEKFNKLYYEISNGHQLQLYKDSAEKIGHMELSSSKGHDWFLSDYYFLTEKCHIDERFVNSNTEKYIIDNVIKKSPDGLKGKELTKWRNQRCKEIFISKKFKRYFGYGITFPFLNGKPLQFCGTDIIDGKSVEVYINEDTGEVYHCKRDRSEPNNIKYDLWMVG